MANFIRISFFVLTALVNISCTTTLNPNDFEIDNVATHNLIGIAPVTIKAKVVGKKAYEIPLPGGNVLINEDDFTQVMVSRVIQELKRNNVPVISASERNIEIQVVKVSLQPTNTFYCVIDFNRKLGNGQYYGFQSRSKNWDYETACEEALKNAVNDVLSDSKTLHYLKGE